MIDPKELRIGNTVYIGKPEVYNEITLSKESFSHLYLFNTFRRLNPIPLTEELLLRFGFEIYASSSVVNGWCIGENPITHDYLFDLKWMKKEDGTLAECFYKNGYFVIKYVHSLQNLYFALTGKELELKPEL